MNACQHCACSWPEYLVGRGLHPLQQCSPMMLLPVQHYNLVGRGMHLLQQCSPGMLLPAQH